MSKTKLHSEEKRINNEIELSVLPPKGHQSFTQSSRVHFIMKVILSLIVLGIVLACCVAVPARHTKVLRSDSDSSDVSQSSDDTSAMGSGGSSSSENSSSGSSSSSEDTSSSEDDDSSGARQSNLAGNPAMVSTEPSVGPAPGGDGFIGNEQPDTSPRIDVEPPTAP